MSSDQLATGVTNISKRYEIYGAPRDRFKQFISNRLAFLSGQTPKQFYQEIWALKGRII